MRHHFSGVPGFEGPLLWANRFVAVPGGELITSVSVAFGFSTGTDLTGTPVTVSLWSDPNGDGLPALQRC